MALRIKKRQRARREPSIIDLSKLEIAMSTLKYCGPYDPKEMKNQTIKFRDKRHGKTCHVRLQDGDIFLDERRD